MSDGIADAYAKKWCESARKCRPVEDWHWKIMSRDYQEEFKWIKLAFMGKALGTSPRYDRGATWEGIETGARRIATALAKRFSEAGRSLPYVNSLWLA